MPIKGRSTKEKRSPKARADFVLQRYHLKDVIVGKIYFLLVRIKIKYMELAIIKRETAGSGMRLCTMREIFGWI